MAYLFLAQSRSETPSLALITAASFERRPSGWIEVSEACNPITARMAASGHLRPSCTIAADGSLSSDSCRSRRMPMMAALGHKETCALAEINFSSQVILQPRERSR